MDRHLSPLAGDHAGAVVFKSQGRFRWIEKTVMNAVFEDSKLTPPSGLPTNGQHTAGLV